MVFKDYCEEQGKETPLKIWPTKNKWYFIISNLKVNIVWKKEIIVYPQIYLYIVWIQISKYQWCGIHYIANSEMKEHYVTCIMSV